MAPGARCKRRGRAPPTTGPVPCWAAVGRSGRQAPSGRRATTAVEDHLGSVSSRSSVLARRCCSSSGSEWPGWPSPKPGHFKKPTAGRLPLSAAAQESASPYWWLARSLRPIIATEAGGRCMGLAVEAQSSVSLLLIVGGLHEHGHLPVVEGLLSGVEARSWSQVSAGLGPSRRGLDRLRLSWSGAASRPFVYGLPGAARSAGSPGGFTAVG